MGAEYRIKLEKNESKKVNAWLKKLADEDLVCIVDSQHQLKSWVWIDPCKTNIVKIGYSFGGCHNGELAIAIGAELIKRTKAKKWGWDSVGWCTQKEMTDFGIPRPFSSRIESVEHTMKKPGCTEEEFKFWSRDIQEMTAQQKIMETWAEELFARTWDNNECLQLSYKTL
jgi:hypothetical protein